MGATRHSCWKLVYVVECKMQNPANLIAIPLSDLRLRVRQNEWATFIHSRPILWLTQSLSHMKKGCSLSNWNLTTKEFSFLRQKGLAVAYTPLGPSKSIAHYKNRPSFRNEQIHEICLVLLILQTHPLHGCSGCCRHSTTAHMWNESFEMIKSNHGNTEILKTHTAMCDAAHVPQTVGQCRSCMQQCARKFIVVFAK